MADDPATEMQINIHFKDWRFEVRAWNEGPDCCSVQYVDDTSKTDPLNLGPPKSARAVAKAILAWCDDLENPEGIGDDE